MTKAARLCVLLIVLVGTLVAWHGPAQEVTHALDASAGTGRSSAGPTPGSPGVADAHAVADLAWLAAHEVLDSSDIAPGTVPPYELPPRNAGGAGTVPGAAMPAPRPSVAEPQPALESMATRFTPSAGAFLAPSSRPLATKSLLPGLDELTALASPAPDEDFLARRWTGWYPPDTNGAVGPDHLMVAVNGGVSTMDKTGGSRLDQTLANFWSSVAPTPVWVFDPKTVYDPTTQRWIFCVGASAGSPNSAILIGVSQTSDPTGLWNLYSVDVDPQDQLWADRPLLGFNKDWISVQVNMYAINDGFKQSDIYAFDKADLMAGGAGNYTVFRNVGRWGQAPASTFDPDLEPLYLMSLHNSPAGQLALYSISGPVSSPLLTDLGLVTGPQGWYWYGPGAPQLGSSEVISTDDDRLDNLVYRNGSLWVAHTVFLPAEDPNRAAVQWWQIDPTDRSAVQQGRIDDPTGFDHYFYGSIAVNACNDALVGYSRSSSQQYVSGNYSFRFATDPPGTMQSDQLLKAGEAPYVRKDGIGRNRWGDYSTSMVDPTNDADMWTIQEYAASPANYWSTWWGRVNVPSCELQQRGADLELTMTGSPDPVVAGTELAYDLTVTNLGPGVAYETTIEDSLPTETRFVSVDAAGATCTTPPSGGSGTVSCTWPGATESGVTRTATITVRTCPDLTCGTAFENSAVAFSETEDPDPENNSAAVSSDVETQSELTITKSDTPDPVVAGEQITYEIIVLNAGPSNAAAVIVEDTLPDETEFVSATVTPEGPACTTAGSVVTCDLGVLGAPEQCASEYPEQYTIEIVVQVSPAALSSVAPCTGPQLVNGATVASANCLPDTGTLSAETVTDVLAGADVQIAEPLVDSAAQCIGPGAMITVRQAFSNDGPGAYTAQGDNPGPEFSAPLPGGVVALPGWCSVIEGGGSCRIDGTTVTWDGEIPVGASVTLEYRARVKGAVPFGTELCFAGEVRFDQCNTGHNSVTRGLEEDVCVEADCKSLIDPNRQLGMQVHLPIMNYIGNDDRCDTWIEVQNVSAHAVKAVLVTWGEPGFCPPQAAGPLKVECTGLLKPGSTWNMSSNAMSNQIPTGSKSGILFKFSTRQLSDDGLDQIFGFDDIYADLMCETLFFGVVGDSDDYRRFKKAYNEGGVFAGIPQQLAQGKQEGGVLAVEVLRDCPADVTAGARVTSKYNGIAGSHLGTYDPVYGSYAYYVPLVYADKAEFNSWIYIQNGGLECSSVEVWFKAQDDCLRARICEVATLAPGETLQLDANDCVGPQWQGSAWIRTSQPMGIAVDIVGRDVLMTYVGEPAQLTYSFDPRGEGAVRTGNQVAFGPLIYSEYQGWDSGIQVQNMSPVVAAKVKVYFLDRSGDIVTTLVDWICPRASQTFFLPVIHDLPGNWAGSVRVESQEWVTPGGPLVAPPDIVGIATLMRYSDAQRTETREAIAYNLLPEHKIFDWQIGGRGAGGLEGGVGLIAVPSLLKSLSGVGLTSELAVANVVPKPGFTDFVIFIYDQNGLVDYACEKLNEKQVEYIDLQSWGYVSSGFKGSAIVSAVFWEHDVFDDSGFFLRNLLGLGAVSIERSRTSLGQDVSGDESAGSRGIPFAVSAVEDEEFEFGFMPDGRIPECPGVPISNPVPDETGS